jgi:sensor histidine kinase YesM
MKFFFNNTVFRLIAPAIYGFMLYLLILLINNNVQSLNDAFTTQELYVSIVLTYLSFETVRAGILMVNRFLRPASAAVLMVVQVAVTTVVSTALVLVVLMAYFKYALGFSISATQLTIFAAIYSATSLLYNVMYLSHYFLHKQNSIKLNAEQQQRTVLEMEMMEYRNQINPDLLYESLENLIAVMYRDVEKAEDYIDALGTAYRYVLTNRENEMVTVAEELEAGRNILRLLNEKCAGQLKLESALGEAEMSAMLIPGSLPVIFESIVRNTIISGHEPFVIRLYMEEEYLAIETRLNDRLIAHQPSEQAFERLQRSYSLYTELPLIKVKAYHQNYIKLPVLRIGEAIGAL